jgi:hypothetical protein
VSTSAEETVSTVSSVSAVRGNGSNADPGSHKHQPADAADGADANGATSRFVAGNPYHHAQYTVPAERGFNGILKPTLTNCGREDIRTKLDT